MSAITPRPRVQLSRLRDIGWSLWDPIGLLGPDGHIAGMWDQDSNRDFADEYDRYLISAASALRQGTPGEEVTMYLMEVESQQMGLGERTDTQKRAEAVVAAILSDDDLWTWPDEQGRFS